jgi:quinol monooxygenase YgiN
MSVFVIARMQVEPANLEKLFTERPEVFKKVSEEAKQVGALHHRFVAGDGEVLIIDEWNDAESFQKFFSSQPDIADLMASAGVQGPPEVSIYRPLDDAPDLF